MQIVKRTAALLAMVLAVAALQQPPARAADFNVRDYGATGNGSTYDDDAIDRAINAASAAPGGTVVFPAGRYRARTIHLKSDVTLRLGTGSTILAAGSGMDAAEPNSYDGYQDYGHSHFRNALMWGENITNFAITGSGTIDGDMNLTTGNSVPSGVADKALSLKLCGNVTLSGVTFRHGGHFMVLMNGCRGVTIDNVRTIAADEGVRDGINVINTSNVTVSNSRIEGSDDALVFKSDYALGRTFVSENIRVRGSTILSTENNALQFGSETCGDFRDVRFDNLTVTGAGKAGIGLVSMDGAVIENVHYNNITMTKTATPIFMKIGQRGRCPGSPPAGRIRDIHLTNVTGTNLSSPVSGAPEFTSTITGTPAADIGPGITLGNVKLTVPGGHPASDADRVPGEYLTTYPPRDYGTRPSYGFWTRHATGIAFGPGTEVRFASGDGRPAFITDDAAWVALGGVVAQRGSGSAYDVGFSGVNGYVVRGSANTSGGALRVRATDSAPGGPPVGAANGRREPHLSASASQLRPK
jgi:hypothetical protein